MKCSKVSLHHHFRLFNYDVHNIKCETWFVSQLCRQVDNLRPVYTNMCELPCDVCLLLKTHFENVCSCVDVSLVALCTLIGPVVLILLPLN